MSQFIVTQPYGECCQKNPAEPEPPRMLPVEAVLFLVSGALAAGLVMGLVGFGTGLAALGLWLFVIEPTTAVPLVALCSLATTALTLKAYRHAIDWRRLAPLIAGALFGLPAGASLLTTLDPAAFKVAMGAFLVLYALFRLLVVPGLTVRPRGSGADLAVGFAGGILSGFAAIPGPLSTVWAGVRGWSKDEQRAVYQPFNQLLLLLAMLLFGWQGLITWDLLRVALYCVPAALLGAGVGMLFYRRLDERQFARLVLLLLLASGVMLVATNLLPLR